MGSVSNFNGSIKNNTCNLEPISNDFSEFEECPVVFTSFDQVLKQVNDYYAQELSSDPGKPLPSKTELLALATIRFNKKWPLEQLEDQLLAIVRSCPMAQVYQDSKAIQEMRALYLRFNQPGALRRAGAKEELAKAPILGRLLQNTNSTHHRLESLNLITTERGAKVPQGLPKPLPQTINGIGENTNYQLSASKNAPVAEPGHISSRNQTFLKIAAFVNQAAEELLNGPKTQLHFQLLSSKLLQSIPLAELLQLTGQDFSQTVAASLRSFILAGESGKNFSTLEQLKLVHIGNSWAEALSTHIGIMIQQSLADRIIQYSRENIAHLNTLLGETEDATIREKYLSQLDHQQRILNRLTSHNSTNYLTALDPNLSKEFPIIFATVLKDYGLPGGIKNNIVQESFKDFQAWKENSDAVYFALGDLATSLAGGKLVKALRTSANFAKNFSKLRSSEPNYTLQECTGRLLVEMAGKELIGSLIHYNNSAASSLFGKAEALDTDQIELITKQLDFVSRHEAGKITKELME